MAFICNECRVELKAINTKTVGNEYIVRVRKCPICKVKFKTIEIKEDVYNNTVGVMNSIGGFLKSILGQKA